MKIESQGAPASNNASPSPQQSARDRAIAKLTGANQAQKAPVANPTQVSAEEMGALKVPSEDPFEKAKAVASEAQRHSTDETSLSPEAEIKVVDEEPISSQYAILARKDKALRQRERQLMERERALKAREVPKAAEQPVATPTFDESKYISREKLTNDPFGILTEMGMTYDQLTEAALNGPKPKEIELMNELKAMREEMRALKGETETTKKSFEKYQTDVEKQGINELTKRTQSLVMNNPEFETIKETGSISDVVDLIKQTLTQDGVLLTVEEAAQEVENYLVEEALKIARIKKIQQRLAPKAAPAAAEATPTDNKQPMKTLTNAVGTARRLTARERALLAFEGKLK